MNARTKSPIWIALAVLPLLAATLACGPLSAAKTPTPTPTATPLPTNTPTPIPTATLDFKATQEAERDQAILEVLAKYDYPTDTGHLGWYQTWPISIDLEGPSGYYQEFPETITVSDFVLQSEITWDTDAWPSCGVIFRSDDRWAKGDQYALFFLRFSGLPAWDIEYYKDGWFVNLVTEKMRFSSYLNLDDGDKNVFILSAIGNEFKVYVNNNFEGRYYDYSKRLSEGMFAFAATQSAGNTTCTFDKTWVWVYK